MATRIKSNQITDNVITADDLHSAITISTTSTINSSNITSTGYIEAAGNISTGADAGRLRAGASNEMQLYFSGSHGLLTSSTGNFTIDSAGDIFLNADGADIVLADDTVDFGRFKRDAGDFVIKAETVDKDIILRGTKAGSPNVTIDALLLDMSNDGRATFNENVIINGNLQVDGTQTILNTTTLDVEDVNITVASEATNSQEADGAGITIEGAGAIFAWNHAQGSMTLNKELRLDNNKGLFFSNAAANATVGLKADTSDNITFRQNGQWDRLVIKNSGVDIAGNIYTGNNLSVGATSALKGYFYESTSEQNGDAKPSSVLGVASNVNSRGEGPSIDFNVVWQGGVAYQQETWDDGWTVGRIAGVYDVSGLDTGALAFYTQTSGSGDGANASGLTEKVRISSSGNVGINQGAPTYGLEVNNASTANDGTLYVNAALNGSGNGLVINSNTRTTNDNADLLLKVIDRSNTVALSTTVSGNVGIGTDIPGALLDVNDAGATDNAWNTLAKFRPDLSDAHAEASIHIQSYPSTTVVADRKAGIQSIDDAGNTRSLILNKDGGYVGIGTSSPNTTLELGPVSALVGPTLRLSGGTGGQLGIAEYPFGTVEFFSNDPSGDGAEVKASISGLAHTGSTDPGGEIAFSTTNSGTSSTLTEHFRLTHNGNVGIGTDDPKRPLQIGTTGSFPISFNGNYPDIHMNTYYESGWRIHTAGFGAKTTFNGATGAFGFSNVASTQNAGANFTPIERLTILANGNVGIGTDTPVHNLDVEGAIATRQVRHNITPSLHFDFANSESLDSRIHFKRQSIASYVDKNGFIAYAAENEPRFDHDPVTKESRGLLIEGIMSNVCNGDNKGLSINYNAMAHIRNEGLAPDGTFSATRVIATGGTQRHEVNLVYNGVGGTVYTGSVYVKPLGNVTHLAMSQAGGTQLIIFDLINGTVGTPGGGAAGAISDAGNGWKRVQLTYTESTTGTRSVYMSPGIGAGGSSVYNNLPANGENGVMLWGAQVEFLGTASSYIPLDIGFTSRASRATYFDKYGIMQLAGSNQARNDHRWDGRNWRKCGRLYESASSNMIPDPIAGFYSGASAGTEINGKAELAPDGTYTAVRFSTTVGSGNRTFSNPGYIPVSANTVYTYSCYVKNISMTGWNIALPQSASTGTITIIKERNTTVSEMSTTEWKRMEITFKTGSNNGGVWVQDFRDGGTGSAILWGKQLEEGHEATSFIYEGTRAADILSVEAGDRDIDIAYMDIEEYWNTEESTLFVESETNITDYTLHNYNATAAAFAPNEGRAQVRYDNTYGLQALGYVLTPASTEIFTLSTNTFPKYSKAALSLKLNDYDLVANGGTPISDSAGIMPNPTKLHFGTYGDLGSSSEPLYGVIKRVSYYDAKLDNSVMQALTEIN